MHVPHFGQIDDTPIYNTRAAVKMTQVEAPRLRAWERRYAILAPHRSANSYRLYSDRDVAIIRWLREQVEAGMTISQATAYLKSVDDAVPRVKPVAAPPVPLPLDALVHALMQAALCLDEGAALHILRQAFAVYDVEEVCESLVLPALYMIGQQWQAGQDIIISEHFLSNIVRAQLDTVWRLTWQPDTDPPVVVACVPGEQHELGAFMLALFLRRRGVRTIFLGQNVDTPALVRMAETLHVAVICLSATLPQHRAQMIAMAKALLAVPGIQIFLGGQVMTDAPATNGHTFPAGVTFLHMPGSQAATFIKQATHAIV
jgi:DNA-binding transcriptional MerR regulator/methylmalonyl-CoA mutase cobalamin-binding subunit